MMLGKTLVSGGRDSLATGSDSRSMSAFLSYWWNKLAFQWSLCLSLRQRWIKRGAEGFFWHGNHMSYDGSTCVHLVRHCAERLELGGDRFDLAMKCDLDFCC